MNYFYFLNILSLTYFFICLGMVNKVFPVNKVVEEAVKLGEKIASHSPSVVTIAKEAVNAGKEIFKIASSNSI